jgi:hypothetical protein
LTTAERELMTTAERELMTTAERERLKALERRDPRTREGQTRSPCPAPVAFAQALDELDA